MADYEHTPSEERMRELLVGKTIVRAELSEVDGTLVLSDGMVLTLGGNTGCGGCGAGWYEIVELNTCDNIITNVEVEERPDDPDLPCPHPECENSPCYTHEGWYRIFVFADNRRINVASFEGTDGNGYYGTGWWLTVSNG